MTRARDLAEALKAVDHADVHGDDNERGIARSWLGRALADWAPE